jgi:DNA-binding response OmpR family regulator
MTQSILIAASDPRVGLRLSSAIQGAGWSVAGPFHSNAAALDWLDHERVDYAILDILLNDGSAFQLAATLHRAGIPLVFFAGYDAHRQMIRAEFPDAPGACREARLLDLLGALECAA